MTDAMHDRVLFKALGASASPIGLVRLTSRQFWHSFVLDYSKLNEPSQEVGVKGVDSVTLVLFATRCGDILRVIRLTPVPGQSPFELRKRFPKFSIF